MGIPPARRGSGRCGNDRSRGHAGASRRRFRRPSIDQFEPAALFPIWSADAAARRLFAGRHPMSQRANELAARFAAVNDDIIATVNNCDDGAWNRVSADEQWSVRVVAHHIATAHRAFADVVDALAAGADPFANFSREALDRGNAEHARANATVGKEAALAALRANGAAAERAIRALSDAQLDRVTPLFDGRALSVADVVESIVIGHPAGHLASIRATIGEEAVAAD
jgi:uncharacterized damage-inducible protein DinB